MGRQVRFVPAVLTLAAFALAGMACARPRQVAVPAAPLTGPSAPLAQATPGTPAAEGQGQVTPPPAPETTVKGPPFGGLPLPPGFPPDAITPLGDRVTDWNETRIDENRVVWGRDPAANTLWAVLGVPAGSGMTPQLLGVSEEAGIPILRASISTGPGAPLILATFPATRDVWAMRLKVDDQEPGIWLGYVPQAMGAALGDMAQGEDPLKTAQAWAKTLGFSAGAVMTAGERGYHDPSAQKTAMIIVKDRGVTYTVRMAQQRGATRWSVWSVTFGTWPKLTPMFLED